MTLHNAQGYVSPFRQNRIKELLRVRGPMAMTDISAHLGGGWRINASGLRRLCRAHQVRRLSNPRYWCHVDFPPPPDMENMLRREYELVVGIFRLVAAGVDSTTFIADVYRARSAPVLFSEALLACLQIIYEGPGTPGSPGQYHEGLRPNLVATSIGRPRMHVLLRDAIIDLSSDLSIDTNAQPLWPPQRISLFDTNHIVVTTAAATGLVVDVALTPIAPTYLQPNSLTRAALKHWHEEYAAPPIYQPRRGLTGQQENLWSTIRAAWTTHMQELRLHYRSFARAFGEPRDAIRTHFGSSQCFQDGDSQCGEALGRLLVYNIWSIAWALMAMDFRSPYVDGG